MPRVRHVALEPMEVTVEEPPNPELVDMSRRFRVSLSLALSVVLLAMSEMIPGQPLEGSPRHLKGWTRPRLRSENVPTYRSGFCRLPGCRSLLR